MHIDTLGELITTFIDDQRDGRSPETIKAHQSKLCQLRRYLGAHMKPRDITREDVKRWQADMFTRKLSEWTIKTTFSAARHFMTWAVTEGHIAINPFEGVRSAARPKTTPKSMQRDTFARMIAAARDTTRKSKHAPDASPAEAARNVALLLMLRHTGGRVGELLAVDIGDLDLERKLVMVAGKTGQRRAYLFDTTIIALREWLTIREAMRPETPALFVGVPGHGRATRAGLRLTRNSAYQMLRKLSERAGVTGRWNPHSFRHAYAIDWLSNGGDIPSLQRALGHSTPEVTMRYYAVWSDKHIQEAHGRYAPSDGAE